MGIIYNNDNAIKFLKPLHLLNVIIIHMFREGRGLSEKNISRYLHSRSGIIIHVTGSS